MNGIKLLLFGIMFILIGGFILVDTSSSLGGYGEILLFVIGIVLGVIGLRKNDW